MRSALLGEHPEPRPVSRHKPYPGWRFRVDADGNLSHEPKLWARIVKWLTGQYSGERI